MSIVMDGRTVARWVEFRLYAVFGLPMARPLYDESLSLKIAAVTVGVFGLVYHGRLDALLLGVHGR